MYSSTEGVSNNSNNYAYDDCGGLVICELSYLF